MAFDSAAVLHRFSEAAAAAIPLPAARAQTLEEVRAHFRRLLEGRDVMSLLRYEEA